MTVFDLFLRSILSEPVLSAIYPEFGESDFPVDLYRWNYSAPKQTERKLSKSKCNMDSPTKSFKMNKYCITWFDDKNVGNFFLESNLSFCI